MSRTLRTSFTIATIALALTACSNPRTAPETAAQAPAAVDNSPVIETPAPESSADAKAPETETESETDAPAPEAAPPAAAPAPTTAAAPATEPTRCTSAQGADGGQYWVTGIDANDPDGGLVVRAYAGTSFEARGVLPMFTGVVTFIDEAEWPSCMVTTNGSVWWEIGHPDFATGGWVNATYLEPLADDHIDQPEEEADTHADCVLFFGTNECVIAYYTGDDITFVEPYSAEAAGELHLACVYDGYTSACDVLAFVGPGDGIGNALTQTPTEFLIDDCANLTGIDQKLACAELATRP